MPSGRIAKPTKLKELAGNPGKRVLKKNEPQASGLPVMPEGMTTIGQVVWKRMVGAMPKGIYTAADSYALASYCEAAAMWHEATSYFACGGSLIVKGSTGQEVISPWVKIQADSARQMAAIGARLGLDPASRQQLNAPPEDEQNANPFLYQ